MDEKQGKAGDMPDPRFFSFKEPITIDDAYTLARDLDAQAALTGEEPPHLSQVAAPGDADLTQAVVFCVSKDLASSLSERSFGLCLTVPALSSIVRGGGPVIMLDNPKLAFALLAARLHDVKGGDSASPRIGAGAQIHPAAVIGSGADIGAHVVIGPGTTIGPGVVIGEGAQIGACVSIQCAKIGARARIAAGVRIGEAGFGFVASAAGIVRMPQLGIVEIGDDVDIGANTTIDRGALGNTSIGDQVKIDNLVQIGHNVRVGNRCIFAAQVGLAGSVSVGDDVIMGAQAGAIEGISIGPGARVAGQSGLMRDIPAGESWGGTPALPGKTWLRAAAAASRGAKKMRKRNDTER